MAKKGLGRGLHALLDYDTVSQVQIETGQGEDAAQGADTERNGVLNIDIRKIEPGPHQPRKFFDEDALRELADSIRHFGVIQPLIVKDCGDYFTIIAGERRFRAARIAKLTTIPAIVKDYTEMETLQVALIENIQRQDLTPIEEAMCYKRLMEDFFFAQEDIAEKTGKNKHAIASLIRLLELDQRTQQIAAEGKITTSHAQVLMNLTDGDMQFKCARQIADEGLSVRASESLVATLLNPPAKQGASEEVATLGFDVEFAYKKAEEELKDILGTKVIIKSDKNKQKGRIEIAYYSPDELDRILCHIKGVPV